MKINSTMILVILGIGAVAYYLYTNTQKQAAAQQAAFIAQQKKIADDTAAKKGNQIGSWFSDLSF